MDEITHKIALLGSTGSIGTQTLEIVRQNKCFKIISLSAHSNIKLLELQMREFLPEIVCVVDEKKAEDLRINTADLGITVVSGENGLCEVACASKADIVLTAVVGISGLKPTIAAINEGKDIALANKETLVTAGAIVTRLAKEKGVRIFPVDSEHSAIFQSLQGSADNKIKKILLTASGGAFFGKTREEIAGASPGTALKNPNWNMGAKVTIDSATLVNKGLEVIEAKWLFDVDIDDIEVLVHRQSIVHSMVQYVDNAVIAQLGAPDMKLPIQYALSYPKRFNMSDNDIDFIDINTLTFEKPDLRTFPALSYAYDAGRTGGLMPCIFNSADEAAVDLFLKGKISFLDISNIIEDCMKNISNILKPTIDDILKCDIQTKQYIYDKAYR